MSSLFEEIDKQKQELPELSNVTRRVLGKRKLNFYQVIAICVMAVGLVGGILIGNLFPACAETGGYFKTCTKEEFNLGLTFLSWAGTFLFALFVFAIGHIINILESIDQKIKNKK